MALTLGKSFDRNFVMRLPFLNGYYDIGTFYNKKSPFLLFRVDPSFETNPSMHGIKINMFKNLESSIFVETFLNLHNYSKSTLDIINQFKDIKADYYYDISFILNETIKFTKIEIGDRVLFDTLSLYGFTLTSYDSEFIFIIAERQNIIKKLEKKIVRTTGIQIATSRALSLLDEFHKESKTHEMMKAADRRAPINSEDKEVIELS